MTKATRTLERAVEYQLAIRSLTTDLASVRFPFHSVPLNDKIDGPQATSVDIRYLIKYHLVVKYLFCFGENDLCMLLSFDCKYKHTWKFIPRCVESIYELPRLLRRPKRATSRTVAAAQVYQDDHKFGAQIVSLLCV